jgi:hypothetical protein
MLGAVWKRWNWLEDGLIPLSAILMHAAWTFPLFALFMRNTTTGVVNPGFSYGLCLAILAGGVIAGKMASRNRMGLVIVAVGGLAAIWIALLLAVPAGSQDSGRWIADILDRLRLGREGEAVPLPFVVGLCAVLLWWRGVRIAATERSEVVGSFVSGVVALLGLLFLSVVLPSSLAEARYRMGQSLGAVFGPLVFLASLVFALGFVVLSRYVGERAMLLSQMSITVGLVFLALVLPVGPSAEALSRWILVFLGSGLTTLALHGTLDTLDRQAEKTGIRVRLDRYWAVTALSLVFAILILGLLVSQIIAPGTIARALGWLGPVWTLLVRVFLLIVYVIAYLFFGLLEPILLGIQNWSQRGELAPFQSPVRLEEIEQLAREPRHIPPIFGQILQGILVLAIGVLIVWLFVTAVRRRKRGTLAEDQVIETRETILSPDLVRSQLRALFNGLRRRGAPSPFVEPGALGDPRRVIRELYQGLLARGVELDVPRTRGQTPHTYQGTLLHLCQDEWGDLETLTRAYEAARYGTRPPTQEQVHAAQAAFTRIDAALQAVHGRRSEELP